MINIQLTSAGIAIATVVPSLTRSLNDVASELKFSCGSSLHKGQLTNLKVLSLN